MSTVTAQSIAKDLAKYGLTANREHVQTNGQGDKGTDLGEVPIIVVSDHDKFVANFPNGKDVIMSALDGSSIRVQMQGVARRMREKDRTCKWDEILEAEIGRLFGAKVRTTRTVVKEVKVFALPNGETTQDEAEAKAAWVDFALARK